MSRAAFRYTFLLGPLVATFLERYLGMASTGDSSRFD